MERHHVSASSLICFIDGFSTVTHPCRCGECQHLDLLRHDLNGAAQLTLLDNNITNTIHVIHAIHRHTTNNNKTTAYT
jgi:hypothetical protein